MNKRKNEQKEIDIGLKLLAKSSLIVFIILLFSKIFSYVYRIIIARYFGPEIYGVFSLALMVFVWFILFSSLGIYLGALRFLSFYRGKNNFNKIRFTFRLSFVILLSLGVLAGIILFLSSEFISIKLFNSPDLIFFLKILSFMIPIQMMAYLFLTVIQSFEKIKAHSFISDFLFNFIMLLFLFFFIFLIGNSKAIVFSYSMGLIVLFFISYFYCRKNLKDIFKKPKLKKETKSKIRREIFAYSLPLIFSGVIFAIFPNTDSFIIALFKGATEVGIYNAAVTIALLMGFFPLLFLRLFFPLITREFSRKNFEVIKQLSKQIDKWILIVNFPIFLLFFLFPGAFINILFGPTYLAAENSLRFLVVGFFFYSLSLVSSSLIEMIGKSKLILINILSISIFNLVLNILLVPRYGISGAAFSTMMSYILLCLILFLQVKHYVSIIPIRKKMMRVVLSLIPPTILLIYLKQLVQINLISMILLGLLFVFLYILLIFLTKSLDKNDLMILEAVKKKISNSGGS